MKRLLLCLCAALSIYMAGCRADDVRDSSKETNISAKSEQTEETSSKTEKQDEISFGYIANGSGEMNVYNYDGDTIEVPFSFTALNKTGHDIGFLVFIDGKLQRYTVKYSDGTISDETMMQKFYCDGKGKQQFSFEILPNTGKKGDKLGIYVCAIVYPSFKPKNAEQPSYQYYGSLSQVVPQQVTFNADVPKEEIKYIETKDGLKLTEDITKYIEYFSAKSVQEALENNTYVNLYQKSLDENKIYSEDGKVTLHLQLYGGVDGIYNTTIFVNNQPITIDGADFIKTEMKANKMAECEITLDLDNLDELNTIYAVSVPADNAYLDYAPVTKTNSVLMINK
ncbi:hypothetical protein [Anaerosacchariphilus polymeriproducens]|uniref:Uncharacterized protein n=1 Tax=Anaerosacchariphilus polymeriproducens TaxID=1812858 RepID=A0A371AZB8_9FIRM|nr:hypothetical protein [Anaerosacchariphilus polymeriproducens]RDU24896.1 hypothetical protein DWV06_01305 [Anaerosacchariphilus polymeriproducens]